jgi:hypothetical protein
VLRECSRQHLRRDDGACHSRIVHTAALDVAHATLWTIVNRNPYSTAGPQLVLPFHEGTHYYDPWNGVELTPQRNRDKVTLEFPVEANGYGAILATAERTEELPTPISPEYIQEGQFDRESGYACTLRLLNMLPRPTAIFTASDFMATGALSAIKVCKLKCPDAVSVVSLGSTFRWSRLHRTHRTRADQYLSAQLLYQLGYTAARLLLDRINGEDFPPQNLVLDIELKIRDSVRRI